MNMVDDVGVTVYTYSSGGFLASEGGLFVNDTVTNFYSNRMRIGFSLQQPAGAWTNGFGYDALKRLTSVTSSAGTFAYNYDALRQREVTNLTLPNTSYVSNYFDPVARLLGTVLQTSTGTTLDSSTYGYNLAGQRVNFTNTAGTVASYAYDPAGQLKVAASTTSSESRGYAYDAASNLIRRTNNTTPTTYTNNGLNELTKEGSVNCTYDATGNLIEKATTMLATNFLYDGENRLAAVTYPLGLRLRGETSFVYDGLGRLRSQMFWQSNAVNQGNAIGTGGGGGSGWDFLGGIYYIYDGKRVIQERDLNNNPMVSYTRGNDLSGSLEGAGGIGGLLERADGYNSTNGIWTNHNYYHGDGNGNITYMESNSQTLAASYRYDAFGNTLASSGTLASSNTYRFSSKEFIPTAGLYYYLYRFYDPVLQRWLNRDPIGEGSGADLYCYLHNNPSDGFVDIFGLWGYNPTAPGNPIGPTIVPFLPVDAPYNPTAPSPVVWPPSPNPGPLPPLPPPQPPAWGWPYPTSWPQPPFPPRYPPHIPLPLPNPFPQGCYFTVKPTGISGKSIIEGKPPKGGILTITIPLY